jgi:protein dithiol oxidoreductase (disulfide-forming)
MKLLLGIVLAAVCAVAQAQTSGAPPTSGRDYVELNPPRPTSTPDQLEVLEFFYYGCPVCYEAQPHIARWVSRAGPGIALIRIPAPFSESAESFAKTFYTLGAMNQIARLHWPIYDNHHFDGKQLHEEKNIADWVARNGVDRERFLELRNSDEIKQRVDAAKKALETYDVKGVPSFVIDGKYVTSARMAGGTREMMRVVEFLVERAAGERKKP